MSTVTGLQLLDYAGNPMAAGVNVSLFFPGHHHSPANVKSTDWTQAGGACPNLQMTVGQEYVALFTGRQGPLGPVTFTAQSSGNAIAVEKYASPSLIQENFTLLQTELWPTGNAWWGDEARRPGGVAWALAYGISAILADFDENIQNQLQAARSQSGQGIDLNAWAMSFLGNYFPRYQNEPDVSYRLRVYALLQLPKCTLASIKFIVEAYYRAILYELLPNSAQNLGWGVAGGYGTRGSYGQLFPPLPPDEVVPVIDVWDQQSRPHLAEIYGIHPPEFVISIGTPPPATSMLGMGTTGGMGTQGGMGTPNGQFTLSDAPPDARLADLVNFVKAGGTHPIYLVFAKKT